MHVGEGPEPRRRLRTGVRRRRRQNNWRVGEALRRRPAFQGASTSRRATPSWNGVSQVISVPFGSSPMTSDANEGPARTSAALFLQSHHSSVERRAPPDPRRAPSWPRCCRSTKSDPISSFPDRAPSRRTAVTSSKTMLTNSSKPRSADDLLVALHDDPDAGPDALVYQLEGEGRPAMLLLVACLVRCRACVAAADSCGAVLVDML